MCQCFFESAATDPPVGLEGELLLSGEWNILIQLSSPVYMRNINVHEYNYSLLFTEMLSHLAAHRGAQGILKRGTSTRRVITCILIEDEKKAIALP